MNAIRRFEKIVTDECADNQYLFVDLKHGRLKDSTETHLLNVLPFLTIHEKSS